VRCSRERLIHGTDERNRADRDDHRRIHSIRHGTHQFRLVNEHPPEGTLGRPVCARKRIINC
jgi:hypothetical protein